MLDWRRTFVAKTSRVKWVDVHPAQPWVLAGLYAGQVCVYDYASQQLMQKIEVCNAPIRCAVFVAFEDWIACATDEGTICIYHATTQEKMRTLDAHTDYIRCLAVHPSLPLLLSCGDDMEIHCWNLKTLSRVATFVSHQDYVMQVAWNPKDSSSFASCSLDGTIKVWSLPQKVMLSAEGASIMPEIISNCNFSLTGHTKGINGIEYCPDKPYILSASDDRTIKIWDCQSRQCLQTLYDHTGNVSHAVFHPYLPIIISASEDGTVRIWNSSTYRCALVFELEMGRAWHVTCSRSVNDICISTDHGLYVAALGNSQPLITMHPTTGGRIIQIKNASDFQTISLRSIPESMLLHNHRLTGVQFKEMGGSSEMIFPHSIAFSPSGRYLSVQGDNQYSILTSQALRVKSYGSGEHFVWFTDNVYAVTRNTGRLHNDSMRAATYISDSASPLVSDHANIDVLEDDKVLASFSPPGSVVSVFGAGPLLVCNVRNEDAGATRLGYPAAEITANIYHPQSTRLIKALNVHVTGVYWDAGHCHCAITTATGVLLFKYDQELMNRVIEARVPETDEGLPEIFNFMFDVNQSQIISACWVGHALFYSTTFGKVSFVTSTGHRAHFETASSGVVYLLGYLATHNTIFAADRDFNLYSFNLDCKFVELTDLIATGADVSAVKALMKEIKRTDMAVKLLCDTGSPELEEVALEYAVEPSLKFSIAVAMKNVPRAIEILEAETGASAEAMKKRWSQVGRMALDAGRVGVAMECFEKGDDLMNLSNVYLALGDHAGLRKLIPRAREQHLNNLAYLIAFLTRDFDACVELLMAEKKHTQAALFARSFKPSLLPELVPQVPEKLSRPGEWAKYDDMVKVEGLLGGIMDKYTNRDYPELRDLVGYDLLDEYASLGETEFVSALCPKDVAV